MDVDGGLMEHYPKKTMSGMFEAMAWRFLVHFDFVWDENVDHQLASLSRRIVSALVITLLTMHTLQPQCFTRSEGNVLHIKIYVFSNAFDTISYLKRAKS
jgi:hypothetical protein